VPSGPGPVPLASAESGFLTDIHGKIEGPDRRAMLKYVYEEVEPELGPFARQGPGAYNALMADVLPLLTVVFDDRYGWSSATG